MKNKIFSLLFLLSLFTACQDKWEEYYVENPNAELEDGATENLMEILRNDANYSKFVSLLESTGIGKELERNQILTVWAPTNVNYPETAINAMSEKEKVTLCKNHINYIALYNTKLQDGKLVKSLAGKNLIIKEPVVDEYSIDGNVVNKLNLTGTNGVIHEIDEWLLPRKNIYEVIEELGDEYSIVRDSLLSWNDTIFMPGESFPEGVDSLGNTIYDSVFVIKNFIFDALADVRNEDNDFTFFLSNNNVIKEMYDSMDDYYTSLGYTYTARDSSNFFEWMLIAGIHDGIIDNYSGTFKSVVGQEWRSEFQQIDGSFTTCSNGRIYTMSKLHVPKFLYLETVKMEVGSIFESMTYDERKKNITVTNGVINGANPDGFHIYKDGSRYNLWANGKSTDPVVVLEFNGFTRDVWGVVKPAVIVPGKYRVKASHRTYLAGNVLFSINGDEVAKYNAGNSSVYGYKDGIVSEEFEIKEEHIGKQIRFRYEDVGKKKRIIIERIILEPTEDNY